MTQLIKNWLQRYFSDPELAILWLFLAFIVTAFACLGKILTPVLVSTVIAYLLRWPILFLMRLHIPHVIAVITVYLLFLGLLILGLLVLMPLLWHQLINLVSEFPNMVTQSQVLLAHLPERYPDYLGPDQIQQLISESKASLSRFGQHMLSAIVSAIPNIIAAVIYLVLVPLLVYFFLMDRKKIHTWLEQYLPQQRRLVTQVWQEVYEQAGNYVRGKVLEIIIVWVATYITFAVMKLQYAMLLSALVGLSVLVPYIGGLLVTVPVLIVAFVQWGWNVEFFYLTIAYSVITLLDGNVLVPLLFSETVNLHPVAIIVSVLIFGGLWGFWGIFFAIPLATLVKAILNALPKRT